MFMQPQTKTNRSLGNSQSRLSAMPSSPAYGNTTNVNGAQTAVGGNARNGSYPGNILSMPKELNKDDTFVSGDALQGMMPSLPQVNTPSAPIYPGGDAPGIASYYRNSAIQGYQGNQSGQQSAMAGDVREATRNAQYMAAESPATSSTGANQMMARQPADLQNAVTARAAKSYNGVVGAMSDPNRLTPNQKAGFARESALRTVGGGAAADPTGLGARFGGALGQQATADSDAIRNGQAVRLADGSVSRFTGTPESARAAQINGKVEREALRDRSNMNVPQEELDRRDAADTAKRGRSARAMAFEDQNGMNYKQADRLARMQERVERQVAKGQITRREADIKLDNQQKRVQSRFQERNSALNDNQQNVGRPLPLAAAPKQGSRNIPAQSPELAAQSVKTMAEQSPVLKSLGVTPESDLDTTLIAVAGMKPEQMTSTQKYEAALHLHEFMLSQLESGNPAYQIGENAGQSGDDPRVSLIGLDALDTKNKDKMVQWFMDLHGQANRTNKPANASPFGNALPIRTGA